MSDASPARQLGALLEVAVGADERAVLLVATRAVTSLLGERGSCVLLAPHPRVVLSTRAPSLRDWPILLSNYPEIVAAVEERRAIVIEDARRDPRLAAVRQFLPRNLGSVGAVPIIGVDGCLGVLLAQSTLPRRFTEEAVETARLIGQQAGALVELARIREKLVGGPASPRTNSGETPVVLAAAGETTLRLRAISPRPIRDEPPSARRVLVIEDEESHASMVALLLEDHGYRTEIARGGVEGIEQASAGLFDVILVDVCMPVLDGFTVAERLKEDPRTRHVPILFLSGSDDLMARVRGLQLGAADFLAKPFFSPELLARVERAIEQAAVRETLRGQAHTDELTGLGNLRMLRECLALEQSRASRYGTALSIVMIDVDGLKKINDTHGHPVGSRVLAEVGRLLREEVRDTDVAVRYGGDEFVVMLPHVDQEEGMALAARVLARAREARVDGEISISLSIGVASLGRGARNVEELLYRADAAAYRAKRSGGDQVCAHDRSVASSCAESGR
jgi:diguanylate cyclase (GGDEF)-like protein